MKSKRQIILETAQGNKCAVGRCLKSNSDIFDIMNEGFSAEDIGDVKLNKELKPSYRGHSVKFWTDLQKFHDEKDNWDDKGLTVKGYDHLEQLLKKWGKR